MRAVATPTPDDAPGQHNHCGSECGPSADKCNSRIIRHLFAGHTVGAFRATAADLGTLLHLVVVGSKGRAGFSAARADLGAGGTSLTMKFRGANHEIGVDLADLHAVVEQTNMRQISVFAAHAQAILHGLDANPVTLGAVVDAVFEVGIKRCLRLRHDSSGFRVNTPVRT